LTKESLKNQNSP